MLNSEQFSQMIPWPASLLSELPSIMRLEMEKRRAPFMLMAESSVFAAILSTEEGPDPMI